MSAELHHHPDAIAPTVTFDDPPDLTPRVPERAYVIIRTNLAGDIESTTVEDGFYYVEFLAYDVAQLLTREQPGWRFFVAVIPDPGVFAFCAPRTKRTVRDRAARDHVARNRKNSQRADEEAHAQIRIQ
jgi:hypothetical protein